MDVYGLVIVGLAICQLTSPTPLESTEAPETTLSTAATDTTTTAPPNTTTTAPNTTTTAASNVTFTAAITNCTTAKGVKGECTLRQDCDYSTAAIDLTLFATHSYVSPCVADEICCPFDALVRVKETGDTGSPSNDDSAFDFDKDD